MIDLIKDFANAAQKSGLMTAGRYLMGGLSEMFNGMKEPRKDFGMTAAVGTCKVLAAFAVAAVGVYFLSKMRGDKPKAAEQPMHPQVAAAIRDMAAMRTTEASTARSTDMQISPA